MKIAVIGAGNIGGALARKWATAGHQVAIGARDMSKPEVQDLARGIHGRATSVEDAVREADAVLFAIPGGSMSATVTALGGALDGKLVMDATNNIGAASLNSVATIAAAAPGAMVYRAFNIYGFENFADALLGGVQAPVLRWARWCCSPTGGATDLSCRPAADLARRHRPRGP